MPLVNKVGNTAVNTNRRIASAVEEILFVKQHYATLTVKSVAIQKTVLPVSPLLSS